MGNHSVSLLQVTHGSPLHLNHIHHSSPYLSPAVLSFTDWNLAEFLRTEVLGNVSELLNEYVWIQYLLDGSLGRCKISVDLLN